MSIGEFAQLTGISAKALRHYDESGVLPPAVVDPASRYRRYGAAQLVPALRLRALRQAGMPLAAAADVMAGGDAAARALQAHRERLAEQRAAQDEALEALRAELAASPWQVQEQRVRPQHWVGAVLALDGAEEEGGRADQEDDAATERGNQAFAALWRALAEAGLPPSGAPWSSFRLDGAGGVQLLCCWPVDRPVADGWTVPGHDVVHGVLPGGAQLVSRWLHDDSTALLPGAVHPAVVALLAEAERRGADVRLEGLRQVVLAGDGEAGGGIEVVVPLAAAG